MDNCLLQWGAVYDNINYMAKKLLLYTLDFYQKNPGKVVQDVLALLDESKTPADDKTQVQVEVKNSEPENPGEENSEE